MKNRLKFDYKLAKTDPKIDQISTQIQPKI